MQITVAEALGVEHRGSFYEQAGALRDIVQNHVMQVLSLTLMEPPATMDAQGIRDEKVKALRAVEILDPLDVGTETVRAQYDAGWVEGEPAAGYRSEAGVDPESRTETFVALRLDVDNWRWAGVPVYIRTGKRLPKRVTEVAMQFNAVPHLPFLARQARGLGPNALVLRIQPDEGISLRFGAKVPGTVMRLGSVNMDFQYADYFGSTPSTGYERLLYDCMIGDQTLFQRADMIEAGWTVVQPVLDVWNALPPRNFPNYKAGSTGPKEADELLERDGRQWLTT